MKDEALEIIESFPDEQKESREEYARGEVRRGTVDDLMLEITQ